MAKHRLAPHLREAQYPVELPCCSSSMRDRCSGVDSSADPAAVRLLSRPTPSCPGWNAPADRGRMRRPSGLLGLDPAAVLGRAGPLCTTQALTQSPARPQGHWPTTDHAAKLS